MRKKENVIGNVYNNITVIEELPSIIIHNHKRRYFLCKCNCGNYLNYILSEIKANKKTKCKKCVNSNSLSFNKLYKSEYKTWINIKYRCKNKKFNTNKSYYDKGITVCDRWLNSFENFLSDMGRKPTPQHSIDRIDNNGNYEPSNCKWATLVEQANNKGNNFIIEYNSIIKTKANWAKYFNISGQALTSYIRKYGKDKAFEHYINKIMT